MVRAAPILALAFVASTSACGKKGPPLPPLVKIPVAPGELTAVRRAGIVDLQFTIPGSNTDNSRPANIARVDVYALTGPVTVPDAEILSRGTRVASVPVKAPRDPDDTFDPGDPEQSEADVQPLEGQGLDQGAVARVEETLSLSNAPGSPEVRTYLGVAITTRGRRGPSSKRVAVPLVATPPAPSKPDLTYTETAVTVSWAPAADGQAAHAYNVYETGLAETLLTRTPVAGTQYMDARMGWGTSRCYGVRTVETVEGLAVESERSEPACVMLVDHFPPAPPKGLRAVATEGVINLIWDANTESDLDGYYLLRGPAPGDELIPVSGIPIRETSFQDRVPPGQRYIYAVQAVDRSGNLSATSATTEETAR